MEKFEQEILDRIGKKLLNKKQTIAVAESVTVGILQYAFSSITGAAQFSRAVLRLIILRRNSGT